MPQFGECPLPSPPPRGRGQVAADSSITGRLKKNARNINSRNFSGSLLSQGRWNKRRERFFRRPLNPSVGCVPQGTRAVGWGCRENRERVRAYRTHPTCRLLHNLFSLQQPLTPTAAPSSLPWERVRERVTSRKACIGAVRVLGKVAAIWRMPSPQPSPTGEGADCSRFKRCRSSEKECRKHQRQDFFR